MEKAIEILLNQGLSGAMIVIVVLILKKRDTEFIQSLHDRLKEKDEIIQKLLDNDLRQQHIIEFFKEVKPLFEEIRELLRRWYSSKVGL